VAAERYGTATQLEALDRVGRYWTLWVLLGRSGIGVRDRWFQPVAWILAPALTAAVARLSRTTPGLRRRLAAVVLVGALATAVAWTTPFTTIPRRFPWSTLSGVELLGLCLFARAMRSWVASSGFRDVAESWRRTLAWTYATIAIGTALAVGAVIDAAVREPGVDASGRVWAVAVGSLTILVLAQVAAWFTALHAMQVTRRRVFPMSEPARRAAEEADRGA
jgi:hypothetical protein